MKTNSPELSLSLAMTFTVAQQEQIHEAIENYIPGGFQSDFEMQLGYTLGSLFTPLIREEAPRFVTYEEGLGIVESFVWEGVNIKLDSGDRVIPLRFNTPSTFISENMIDLQCEEIYPRCYHLLAPQEIVASMTELLISHLNRVEALYFLLSHKTDLFSLFKPVFDAMGPRPIHLGILKQMAREPSDHAQFNSRHLTSSEINRRSMQTHTDVTRSHHLVIRAEERTWQIRENDTALKKAEIYEDSLQVIQTRGLLPASVLDALKFGAHQSGFLNEAVIALGVYMTVISNCQITLPQSGVQRRMAFNIRNRQVEVHDECEWHQVVLPCVSPGGSSMDRAQVTLHKPLMLSYRYILSEDNRHRLSHQIKEIFLQNEHKVRALLPK